MKLYRVGVQFVVVIISLILSACSPSELKSPCPSYGTYCKQMPINEEKTIESTYSL